MIAFRVVQPPDALRFIDFSTLVLLFSMMLIVGNLRLVGFFEWNAELVLQRLQPTHLLPAVIFTCGILSAFLVNDIVCLVMVPFVLGITRRMRLQPLPYLLAVATASNIGSVATITGNPQNMLIGSFSGIRTTISFFIWGQSRSSDYSSTGLCCTGSICARLSCPRRRRDEFHCPRLIFRTSPNPSSL